MANLCDKDYPEREDSDSLISGYLSKIYFINLCILQLQIVSMGRKKFSADFQLMFRLLKLILFIGFIGTLVILFVFLSLTVGDIFASLLAFIPTGWALLGVHFSCSMFHFAYCMIIQRNCI